MPADYKIVPLSELGAFLEANRHLPGLPREKLTGNVDTAEIDRLLLEKLEEQTLYILQLKEEKDNVIAELKASIQALEAQKSQPCQTPKLSLPNPNPPKILAKLCTQTASKTQYLFLAIYSTYFQQNSGHEFS